MAYNKFLSGVKSYEQRNKEEEEKKKKKKVNKFLKGVHSKVKKEVKIPDVFTRDVLKDAANRRVSEDTTEKNRIKSEAKKTRETFSFLSPNNEGKRRTSTRDIDPSSLLTPREQRDPADIPSSLSSGTKKKIDIPRASYYPNEESYKDNEAKPHVEIPEDTLNKSIEDRTNERERIRNEKIYSDTAMNLTAGLNDVLGGAAKTLKWIRSSGPASDPVIGKYLSEGKIQEAISSKLEGAIDSFEKGSTIYSVSDPTLVDKAARSSVSAASFYLPGYGVMKASQAMNMSRGAASMFGNITMTVLEASMEAGEVYDTLIKNDMSPSDANNKALQTFGLNALLIGITNKYGLGDFAKKNLAKKLLSGPSEGIQEAIQQIISNSETGRPMMEGVGESALIGTILGLPMGMISSQAVNEKLDNAPPKGYIDPVIVKKEEEKKEKYQEPIVVEDKPVTEKEEYKEPVIVDEKAPEKTSDELKRESYIDFQPTVKKSVKDLSAFEAETREASDKPSRDQIDIVKAKIERGEKTEPILLIKAENGNFSVDDGKHRLQAYKELGIEQIETKDITGMQEALGEKKETVVEPKKVESKPKEVLQAEGQITIEFDAAVKGSRSREGGVKSTFPSWIPHNEGIREKPVLDAVSKHLIEGTVPTSAAQLRLYNVVQKRIQKQIAINKKAPKGKQEVDSRSEKKKLEDINNIQFEKKSLIKQVENIEAQITKAKAEGKSFDEFVGKQDTVYHGTLEADAKKINAEGFKGRKEVGKETPFADDEFFGDVTYITSNKKQAQAFAEQMGGKRGVSTFQGKGTEVLELVLNKEIRLAKQPKANTTSEYKKAVDALKKDYDGLDLPGGIKVVWNKEKIKTKSQLKELWDKQSPTKAKVKAQMERKAPTEAKARSESESKTGISSSAYYQSKGEFNLIDIPGFVSNIELPEMVAIYKKLTGGEVPFLKKYPDALGAFYPDATSPKIGINPSVFKSIDTNQAAKTMGHELGHFVEDIPGGEKLSSVRRKILGDEKLIQERRNVMRAINKWDSIKINRELTSEESKKLEAKVKRLNEINKRLVFGKEYIDELKALTHFWKPFKTGVDLNYDAYRYSSPELYADFMSVLLNRPDIAKQKAPKFSRYFFDNLDKKPEVSKAFIALNDMLSGGKEVVIENRIQRSLEGFRLAEELKQSAAANRKYENSIFRGSKLMKQLATGFMEKNSAIIKIEKAAIKAGEEVKPEDSPSLRLEELDFLGNEIADVLDKIEPIDKKREKANISSKELGLIMESLRVTTGRKEFANPGGETAKTAKDKLEVLRNKWGEEKYNAAIKLANEMNNVMKEEISNAADNGLYSEKFVEDIMDSKDYYATFRVIDYIIDGHVSGAMMKTVGTFKDIENPYESMMDKMIAIRMASKRNKAILSTADLLLSQVGEEEISKTEDKEKTYKEIEDIVLAKKNYTTRTFKEFIVKNGKKLDLITWKDNGKVKGLYVDPLIALSFKTQTVENLGQLLSITNFFNNIARSLFIKYNLKFIQRNAPRDVQAAWKAMQMLDLQGTGKFGMKKADYIIKMKKARKELADFYSSEGRLKSKNVQKALDLKILGVERDYTYNDKDIEAMSTFEREMVTRGLRKKDGSTDKKKIWQTAQKPLEVWEVLNGSLESSTKLAAMMQIEERLAEEGKTIDAKTAAFIRNKVGTPNWRKGGLYKRQMNALYLFSNVNIQGWKRSIELATDANTRSGYIWRTAMIAAPTFLMKAIEMGLFDNPDADDDKKLSIMMKSIKNYYKQKTVIFAVPGWEDSYGQQRGLAIPLDYTDEAIHGMVWELLGSLEDGELKTQELFSIMASIFPDITPTIDVAGKWLQYAKDLNPYDDYYGNNWISKENMELGGMYALKDMLKKTWNSFFSGIYRVETYDMPKGKSLADKVLDKTPFVVSSSYGLKEESDKEARDSINKGNLENKEEQKIIIEHLRNFYDDGGDIKNFSKYMNKATDDYIDNYDGEIIKSDITYFRKKFAKKYIGQEDIQIRAILSSGDTLEEISRIKSFLKTSSNETYENFKEFALTNKIITWKSFSLAEKKEDE